MKVSILTENRTSKGKFLAEHGLSVFIEFNDMNILFDTGQTDVYCHNADIMGVDLSKTDCIVLSHGHYDHCGGYVHFPVKEKYPVTYVREKAFERKFTKDKNGYREIGIPWKYEDYKDRIIFTGEKTQIAENIYLCSDIPFSVPFEEPFKGLLVQNGEEKITDRMQDEQMLVIDTEKGLVIFIGCSHPGIANCLSYAKKLFPDRKINTVFAGMHLEVVSDERFRKTIEFLKKLDIERIIPVHCTGVIKACEMKRILGEHCSIYGAGDSFEI